ncbi:hypothetical protein HWQ46_11030 [Shewanella sp. D64]|uniref:hypothetical protein n=1 Tax=unclassified Shewanella TaxID=196818 RepID=UPI0022BA3E6C|nr:MULTISPECIES: hypothetical protein [unclassified Shewanella]MEC4726081.1 hypothetical protein [Shewanella sp. D64]MEC4738002.1 hypothetical protein [Shewanella sp. E94]WBJ96201.1 hypothetical protein HWQ47_03455 [Shewanella sp. MTB7]
MTTWKAGLVFSCVVLLAACSNVSFRTNISPDIAEVATRSIAASDVREFTIEEISRRDKEMLGEVRSSYCQAGFTTPAPSRALLATDMRYKTTQLGGNVYVVMECFNSSYASCNAYMECRALAYVVTDGSL